jgi:hypothetical protein
MVDVFLLLFLFLFPPLLLGGGVRIKLSYFSVLLVTSSGMAGYSVFLDLGGLGQYIFFSFLVSVDQVLSLYSTLCLSDPETLHSFC